MIKKKGGLLGKAQVLLLGMEGERTGVREKPAESNVCYMSSGGRKGPGDSVEFIMYIGSNDSRC